jgi:hypothetical protein
LARVATKLEEKGILEGKVIGMKILVIGFIDGY